jgi:glucoamylase
VPVDDTALPGTTVFSTSDPRGDDNGPGTYQYPTASDFIPGAFDLTAFKVSETSTDVYLQTSIRALTPTFGSDFGAQLLDIYVHDPAASDTSTAAAYSAMNYDIAGADAWSERLEGQGFAPAQWVSASGASLGTPNLIVDDAGGTATFVVPRATFGSVGPGWTFTLALTGQGSNPAVPVRDFTATAQAYTFGVCAPGASSPICALDPNSVPKVMDTITPAGVAQSDELDPTKHSPVTLAGVGPS